MSAAAAYFDRHHGRMSEVTATEGCKALAYDQQTALLESLLEPGMTILDVGCGPSLPYTPPPRTLVIGIDPSPASLAANRDIDQAIVGTAEAIQLPSNEVDVAVAFYSFHHMQRTPEARGQALWELRRVLRPGGALLVFEMCPWPLAGAAQRVLWPVAKHILGDRLDAYFWTAEAYRRAMPYPSTVRTFDCPALTTFPPVLSLPWLRIPRFLYPMTPTLVRWRKES